MVLVDQKTKSLLFELKTINQFSLFNIQMHRRVH